MTTHFWIRVGVARFSGFNPVRNDCYSLALNSLRHQVVAEAIADYDNSSRESVDEPLKRSTQLWKGARSKHPNGKGSLDGQVMYPDNQRNPPELSQDAAGHARLERRDN